MSKWSDFYLRKATNVESIRNFKVKYTPYFREICKSMPYCCGVQIEFGCGTGIVSRVVSGHLKTTDSVLVDNDSDVLDLARLLNSLYKFNPVLHEQDIVKERILSHTTFNVAHSHGVLEHFDNESIKRTVRNMRDCANSVICYVPSSKYDYKSFGDERLLTPKAWKRICAPKEIIEFNDGYDLILKW